MPRRDKFLMGVGVGLTLALLIIGPFGFFALSDTPVRLIQLRGSFIIFTATGIGGLLAIGYLKRIAKPEKQTSS